MILRPAQRLLLLSSLSCWACVEDLEVGRLQQAPITTSEGDGSDDSDAMSSVAPSLEPNDAASRDPLDASETGDASDAPGVEVDAGCEPFICRGATAAECGDCLDNDGDGVSDSADPECWSACDDSEDGLGDTRMPCANSSCYWDFNCGLGDDDSCGELTPNGCDCHGCCQVPGAATPISLALDTPGACDLTTLDDPDACPPCTLDPECENPCAPCELCFAQTTLPAECSDDAGCVTPVCPDGRQACGGCAGSCPDDAVCISGCCAERP